MSGEWRQFVMNLESIDVAHVEAALFERGAQAVTLSDAGDAPVLEPAPGETPLWAETRITALFNTNLNVGKLKSELCQELNLDSLPPNRVEMLSDRVWEREWLKDFRAMQFGRRLWVVPHQDLTPFEDDVVVRLDPGMAFGTGTHSTTALCLEWLDDIELVGESVLDFGCGSGILGIAACKLGAAAVECVDIDLQAVTASRQNAMRNHVADRLTAGGTVANGTAQFDVVIANILAGTLIDEAALLTRWLKPGGKLALSGILTEQAEAVTAAYADVINFGPSRSRDGWVLVTGTKH